MPDKDKVSITQTIYTSGHNLVITIPKPIAKKKKWRPGTIITAVIEEVK